MISHRQTVDRITPYVPGKSSEEVAQQYGVTHIVKLASNENPLGPPPMAIEAIQREATNSALYPDGASRELVRRLAERVQADEDMFIVGNGSDEVLKLLAEAYLEPGNEVVYADPTFSEYAYVTRLMGAEEVRVPLTDDGVHDLAAMRDAVTDKTKFIFICNPNNPTGTAVNEHSLRSFLSDLPSSVLVIVDEAYVEYVDMPSFPDTVALMREGFNVVVTRTFSKVYGLAGLRVGYGIGPQPIIDYVRRVKEPFNVNRLAQVAAIAALQDNNHLQRSIQMNEKERARLTSELEKMGLRVTPSEANFVWVHLKREAQPIFHTLLQRGVIIREGSAFGHPEHVRITVGTHEQNNTFLHHLQRVLNI